MLSRYRRAVGCRMSGHLCLETVGILGELLVVDAPLVHVTDHLLLLVGRQFDVPSPACPTHPSLSALRTACLVVGGSVSQVPRRMIGKECGCVARGEAHLERCMIFEHSCMLASRCAICDLISISCLHTREVW